MRFGRDIAIRRCLMKVAVVLALSACYEEEDQTIAPDADVAPKAQPAATGTHWLEVDDARRPDEFLAGETGQSAETLSGPLQALSAHYRESPRMIANRVLQLWQEYPDTPLDRLMRDLVPAPGTPERSLGPIAQQYRVLRNDGADHDQAIAGTMRGGAQ